MKIKIKNLFFQRNGVNGVGFYSMTFTGKEGKKSYDMIATFESDQNDQMVSTSCRVVALDLPDTGWDGWNIGLDIEKEIKKQAGNIYTEEGLYKLIKFVWK